MSRYNLRSSSKIPMIVESKKEVVYHQEQKEVNVLPIQSKPTNLILVFDTETTGLIPPENYSRTRDSHSRLEYMKETYPNILQLSYLLYDTCNKTIVEKGNYYIKIDPSIIIQEQSIAIHGITREKLEENGVSIDFALMKFYNAYMRANLIIGHNLDFDKKMMHIEFERNSNNLKKIGCTNPEVIIIQLLMESEKMYCTMKNSMYVCNIVLESNRMGKLGPHEYMETVDIHGMMYEKRMYVKYPTLAELYHKLFGTTPTGLHDSMVDVETCLECYLTLSQKKSASQLTGFPEGNNPTTSQ